MEIKRHTSLDMQPGTPKPVDGETKSDDMATERFDSAKRAMPSLLEHGRGAKTCLEKERFDSAQSPCKVRDMKLASMSEPQPDFIENKRAMPSLLEHGRGAKTCLEKERFSTAESRGNACIDYAEARKRSVKNQPLISVIIPVYNVSAYLDECVNSVIGQTYQHLEILLVDDGSPDDCPQKCDDYAAKDNRIKVIHQKNGGLSAARNAALDICQGEYITFIDSDDVVAYDYIYELYKTLNDNRVEIAVCAHQDFRAEIPLSILSAGETTIYNAHDAVRTLFTGGPFDTTAWAKLYSRRLFQALRFPNGMVYEDLPTVWQAFAQVEKVAYTPAVKYYYRQSPDGITRTRFTHKNLDIIKAHELILDNLPAQFLDLTNIVRARLGVFSTGYLYQALLCSFPDFDALKTLQKAVKQNRAFLLRSKAIWKIKLLSLFLGNDWGFRLFYMMRTAGKTVQK